MIDSVLNPARLQQMLNHQLPTFTPFVEPDPASRSAGIVLEGWVRYRLASAAGGSWSNGYARIARQGAVFEVHQQRDGSRPALSVPLSACHSVIEATFALDDGVAFGMTMPSTTPESLDEDKLWIAVASERDRSQWTAVLDEAGQNGLENAQRKDPLDVLNPIKDATPLMHAVRAGNDDLMRLLVTHCDCRLTDANGENATIWALKYRNGPALEVTAREWLSQLIASHGSDAVHQQGLRDVNPKRAELYRHVLPLVGTPCYPLRPVGLQSSVSRLRRDGTRATPDSLTGRIAVATCLFCLRHLVSYTESFGSDTDVVQSGIVLALLVSEVANPLHFCCRLASFYDKERRKHGTAEVVEALLQQQALAVAGNLARQIPDVSSAALLLASYDQAPDQTAMTLERLLFRAKAKAVLSQPAIERNYLTLWYCRSVWDRKPETMLMMARRRIFPVVGSARFWFLLKSGSFVVFLIIQAWLSTIEASLVNSAQNTVLLAIFYVFGVGHFVDEWLRFFNGAEPITSYMKRLNNFLDVSGGQLGVALLVSAYLPGAVCGTARSPAVCDLRATRGRLAPTL